MKAGRFSIWSALRCLEVLAVVGALVLGIINQSQPGPDRIRRDIATENAENEGQIRQLIAHEATAALDHDVEKAVSLYAPEAVVRDARGGISWFGPREIRDRYSKLPEFKKLAHVDLIVTVNPSLESASALGSTEGEFVEDGGLTHISSVAGEQWSFAKIEGVWKIASFTYNAR